jgi:hypothetical protein
MNVNKWIMSFGAEAGLQDEKLILLIQVNTTESILKIITARLPAISTHIFSPPGISKGTKKPAY